MMMKHQSKVIVLFGCIFVILLNTLKSHVLGSTLKQKGGVQSRRLVYSPPEWDPDCTYGLHMLFLQDISDSFKDDVEILQDILPSLIENLIEDYPESKFAFSSFSDYPMPQVGWGAYEPKDYCFHLDEDFTTNGTAIGAAVHDVEIRSGLDFPEAQLSALLKASKGDVFLPIDPTSNFVRVIVLSTDAEYHVAGDLAENILDHPQLREENPWYFFSDDPYEITENDGDGNLQCSGLHLEDYPTIAQVSESLKEENVMVIFLVTSEVLSTYQILSDQLRDAGGWATAVEMAEDSSNIEASLAHGLEELYELQCLTTTSTITTTSSSSFVEVGISSEASVSIETETDATIATASPSSAAMETTDNASSAEGSETTFSSTAPPNDSTNTAVVVGAAAAGAAAAAGVAALAYTKLGVAASGLGGGGSAATQMVQTADLPDTFVPRDIQQEVTAEMFSLA